MWLTGLKCVRQRSGSLRVLEVPGSTLILPTRIIFSMDILSSILKTLKLEAIVCEKLVLQGAWGLALTPSVSGQFWRLVQGTCVIGLAEGEPLALAEGDVVFLPHQASHWLADDVASRRLAIADYVAAHTRGTPPFRGAGPETVLVGGQFRFDQQHPHPFLRSLPPLVRIPRFGTSHQQLLAHTGQLMLAELTEGRPGGEVMLKSLAEMLFVSIIRAYLAQRLPTNGFLAALNDPQISLALSLMHQTPEQDWTLHSLAASSAMSRSVFANRFKQLVGETPLTYLTNWRISKAQELLATEKTRVSEVAGQVGYQSEAAFNRVFKAKTGETPAAFRRGRAEKSWQPSGLLNK